MGRLPCVISGMVSVGKLTAGGQRRIVEAQHQPEPVDRGDRQPVARLRPSPTTVIVETAVRRGAGFRANGSPTGWAALAISRPSAS